MNHGREEKQTTKISKKNQITKCYVTRTLNRLNDDCATQKKNFDDFDEVDVPRTHIRSILDSIFTMNRKFNGKVQIHQNNELI